jgi:hypothetical protein
MRLPPGRHGGDRDAAPLRVKELLSKGETHLAARLPGILPPLEPAEAFGIR